MGSIVVGVEALSGLKVSNPAMFAGEQNLSLSDMAQSALKSVSSMQSGFQNQLAAQPKFEVKSFEGNGVNATMSKSSAQNPADSVAAATLKLTEQIEKSGVLQAQLTRFVAASSISSSLGKNLNMFLRGQ